MQKILLIEDERLHRITAAKILSDSGYKVITAEDNCQGFEFALEYKPSVIILDLGLPAAGALACAGRGKWADTPKFWIQCLSAGGLGQANLSKNGSTLRNPGSHGYLQLGLWVKQIYACAVTSRS